MKTMKWFRNGENIPDNAKFIKHERRVIDQVIDHPLMDPISVYDDFYLFEIETDEQIKK
jgi:hypothetical protein